MMARSVARSLYRCLLGLHPPYFQAQFANEMLWIFDETAKRQGVLRLLGDGLLSLARQWFVRLALQKWLIGDLAPASWPSLTPELFAWERIALPEGHLPFLRMAQGSVICFLFVMVPMTLLYSGSARPFRGISTATRQFGHAHGFAGSDSQGAPTVSGVNRKGNHGMGSAFGDGEQPGLVEGDGSLQITAPRPNAFDGILGAFQKYK